MPARSLIGFAGDKDDAAFCYHSYRMSKEECCYETYSRSSEWPKPVALVNCRTKLTPVLHVHVIHVPMVHLHLVFHWLGLRNLA